jgi:AcrR family transcriptional regulator
MTQRRAPRKRRAVPKSAATSSRSGTAQTSRRPTRRREQQRAIETRRAILDAALIEFAERGFEAASIRRIADRTGFQHPLITYHFPTKDILWRAVADDAFTQIRARWDERVPPDSSLSPLDQLREEYHTYLRFTVDYPRFYQFMLHESKPRNPRLTHLVKTYLNPLVERLLPQVRAAQRAGELPPGNPLLIHYLLIGATSVLASFSAEIRMIGNVSADKSNVVNAYWALVDQIIFGQRAAFPTPRQRRR